MKNCEHPWGAVNGDGVNEAAKCLKCGELLYYPEKAMKKIRISELKNGDDMINLGKVENVSEYANLFVVTVNNHSITYHKSDYVVIDAKNI